MPKRRKKVSKAKSSKSGLGFLKSSKPLSLKQVLFVALGLAIIGYAGYSAFAGSPKCKSLQRRTVQLSGGRGSTTVTTYCNNWTAPDWGGWSKRVGACETGGRQWARGRYDDKGDAHTGAYQFSKQSWNKFRGYTYAWQAPAHDQDYKAWAVWSGKDGSRPWDDSYPCWRADSTAIQGAPAIPECGLKDRDCGTSAQAPSKSVTLLNCGDNCGAAADKIKPNAPQIRFKAVTKNAATIEITKPHDNIGVVGFEIHRRDTNNPNYRMVARYSPSGLINVAEGKKLNYVDKNLRPGTTYTYFLRAYDQSNNLSTPSNEANFVTRR